MLNLETTFDTQYEKFNVKYNIIESVPTFLVSHISFAIRGGGYVSEEFQIFSLN
jgi:hypothetical protein